MKDVKIMIGLILLITGLFLCVSYLQLQNTLDLTARIKTLEANFLFLDHVPFLAEED